MPFLLNACDIYVAPSRLEGFGMPQVEAGACGKPVISINAMAPKETLVHGETALLAGVAEENWVQEIVTGPEAGFPEGHRIVFDEPRVGDYRASVPELAEHLRTLMKNQHLREQMGSAGRKRVVASFDYRHVARSCLDRLLLLLETEKTSHSRHQASRHENPVARPA